MTAPGVLLPANALSGYVFIAGAAWIAPTESKRIPSIVVGCFGYVIALSGLAFSINDSEWMKALQSVAIGIGLGIGLNQYGRNGS
jgi:ABC-type phosphate transport system permease subunit